MSSRIGRTFFLPAEEELREQDRDEEGECDQYADVLSTLDATSLQVKDVGTAGANNAEAVVCGNRYLLALTAPATTLKTPRLHAAAKAMLGFENGSTATVAASHAQALTAGPLAMQVKRAPRNGLVPGRVCSARVNSDWGR